jgi:hypothetical protein
MKTNMSAKIIITCIWALFSVNSFAQSSSLKVIKPLGISITFNYAREFTSNLNGLDISLAVQLSKKTCHRIISTFGGMGYGNWELFNSDYPTNDGYYRYAYADIKYMYKIFKKNKAKIFLASGIGKNWSTYSSPFTFDFGNQTYTRIDITDRDQLFIPLSIMGEYQLIKDLNFNISFVNHFQRNAPNIFYFQAGLNLNF